MEAETILHNSCLIIVIYVHQIDIYVNYPTFCMICDCNVISININMNIYYCIVYAYTTLPLNSYDWPGEGCVTELLYGYFHHSYENPSTVKVTFRK